MTGPGRILQRAGIAAPLVFFATVLILGALEPGFSHLSQPMSILGGVPGPRGILFNAGIGLTGLLMVLFAIGLGRSIRPGGAVRTGTALLVLAGIGMIGSAVFSCNAGCVNVLQQPDTVGILHGVASFLAGAGSGLATIAFWLAMRADPYWKRFARPTLITAILANGAGILFWIEMASGWRMPGLDGLIQRLGIVFTLIWMIVAARRMRGVAK